MHSARRIAVRPGDLPRGVDALCEGGDRTRWVEAGDGASGIANEAMQTTRIAVRPGDFPCGVDARWPGAGRTWYVKAGDGAPAIANEAMPMEARIAVKPGDFACGVDACWEGAGRTRYVKGGDGLSLDRRDRWGQHAHKEHHRKKPFSISHQTNSLLRPPASAGCVVGRIS